MAFCAAAPPGIAIKLPEIRAQVHIHQAMVFALTAGGAGRVCLGRPRVVAMPMLGLWWRQKHFHSDQKGALSVLAVRYRSVTRAVCGSHDTRRQGPWLP